MGLAEDLKALQELRDKGELTESAYVAARDAVLSKHAALTPSSVPIPTAASDPTVSRRGGRHISTVLLVLGLILLGLVLFYVNNKNAVTAPVLDSVSPAPIQTPVPHSVPIGNGALTVNRATYSYYQLTVPPGSTAVSVSGHFTASGGVGNDIIIYVTDEDGFVNLKNGHAARVFYNSGKVTQAGINAALPNSGGLYYVVLDNRFSPISPKAVQIDASLNYTK